MDFVNKATGSPGFSIEVVPPARGAGLAELFRALEAIMPHGPAFASVTDHPGGSAYSDTAWGRLRVPLRGKPGTLGTALALEREFGVRTVPHILSSGADRFAVEDLLIDLDYAGIREIFVVRGDQRGPMPCPAGPPCAMGIPPGVTEAPAGYASAAELVAHVAALNRGEYLAPTERGKPTSFSVGVAGYPEKHYAAPDSAADIMRLKEKVEAGASYIVTQMVFEARPYFAFVERLRASGIGVPVVPGLKPLVRASQAESVPASFHVDLPDGLFRALAEAKSPAEERIAGIAWTADLADELLAGGAPALHFFTMGKGSATRAVLDAVYGTR